MKPLHAKMQQMSKLADATIETVHRIATELRPGLLDDLGLAAAIEWQAADFQNRSGIACTAALAADDLELDRDLATALFRIFQETLTNIARHAGATRVEVSLERSEDRIVLTVADNGRGITRKQSEDDRAFGIIGMRERAHLWGGELRITGSREEGTTVTVDIPAASREDRRPGRARRRPGGAASMIRILVVDDHAIVREGLKQILGDVNDMSVRDEAAGGQEALAKIRSGEFDVVLLDISMPGRSGLEILKEIKAERPKLPVLILSMHAEEQYAVRALRAGASGYLTKASAPDELIGAIRKVSCGRKYVSASLAEKLALELDIDTKKPPHATLSDREYQVMLMLASGKSVKEIADELCLSVKTISTYRSRVMEKMNMKKNAELTLYAIQNHLVDYSTTTF